MTGPLIGYLSKVQGQRFVSVEHLNDLGVMEIDYFQIDDNLNPNLTSAVYPNIPSVNPNDPLNFFITKNRDGNALGGRVRLSDNQGPNAAFNIFNDRLVSIPAYANTAQYNIPLGQTFPLDRAYDGATSQIQVPGLGLESSKILAVADLP